MRSSGWNYLICFLLFPLNLLSQDYQWWNETHGWDGSSHWSSYIKLAPAFMGPNAFPIPIPERHIKESSFEMRFSQHFNKGEQSRDLFAKFSLPIGTKAALKLQVNPVEYYQMDALVRDERFARDEFPEGYAFGDVLLEMNALIFEKEHSQILFNFGLKTASGSHFRNARYTDSPAYLINFSYHTSINLNDDLQIDMGALLGLYVWQTYLLNNRQNDAFLASFVCDLMYKNYIFSQSLRGFKGYLNQGDSPLLYVLKFAKNWQSYQFYIQQQITLMDYPYNSLQLGGRYYF